MGLARRIEADFSTPSKSHSTRKASPAGFWERFIAVIIDSAILFVINLFFNMLYVVFLMAIGSNPDAYDQRQRVNLMNFAMGTVVHAIYYCVYYQSKGATPGKAIMGLKVIDH